MDGKSSGIYRISREQITFEEAVYKINNLSSEYLESKNKENYEQALIDIMSITVLAIVRDIEQ